MRKIKEYSFIVLFAWVITAFGAYAMQVDYQMEIVSTLPIVFLFYRYGVKVLPISLAYGVGNGAVIAMAAQKDYTSSIVYYVIVASLLAIHGLFAKNVHRTLNNRRMASVNLNNVTATLMVSLGLIGLDFVFEQRLITTHAIYYAVFTILFVALFAKMKPHWILTKRSLFLSSKERSKLLND